MNTINMIGLVAIGYVVTEIVAMIVAYKFRHQLRGYVRNAIRSYIGTDDIRQQLNDTNMYLRRLESATAKPEPVLQAVNDDFADDEESF